MNQLKKEAASAKLRRDPLPLFRNPARTVLVPPKGAFLLNLVPFVLHYDATLYVYMHG